MYVSKYASLLHDLHPSSTAEDIRTKFSTYFSPSSFQHRDIEELRRYIRDTIHGLIPVYEEGREVRRRRRLQERQERARRRAEERRVGEGGSGGSAGEGMEGVGVGSGDPTRIGLTSREAGDTCSGSGSGSDGSGSEREVQVEDAPLSKRVHIQHIHDHEEEEIGEGRLDPLGVPLSGLSSNSYSSGTVEFIPAIPGQLQGCGYRSTQGRFLECPQEQEREREWVDTQEDTASDREEQQEEEEEEGVVRSGLHSRHPSILPPVCSITHPSSSSSSNSTAATAAAAYGTSGGGVTDTAPDPVVGTGTGPRVVYRQNKSLLSLMRGVSSLPAYSIGGTGSGGVGVYNTHTYFDSSDDLTSTAAATATTTAAANNMSTAGNMPTAGSSHSHSHSSINLEQEPEYHSAESVLSQKSVQQVELELMNHSRSHSHSSLSLARVSGAGNSSSGTASYRSAQPSILINEVDCMELDEDGEGGEVEEEGESDFIFTPTAIAACGTVNKLCNNEKEVYLGVE